MFNKEQLQRFSIRKLTVGTASVLIGVLFLTSWNTNKVYADPGNVTSGVAKNNNPQEGNPAVKDNAQIGDNGSTKVSNISDSKSSKVIKSDATNRDNVRDKNDNSGTEVPELTAQASNKKVVSNRAKSTANDAQTKSAQQTAKPDAATSNRLVVQQTKKLTGNVKLNKLADSKAQTDSNYSVTDNYPEDLPIDFDNKQEYAFEWLRNENNNDIILTTNRTGDGVVHVYQDGIKVGTYLAPNSSYTLYKNIWEDELGRVYVYGDKIGTVHNDNFAGIVQSNGYRLNIIYSSHAKDVDDAWYSTVSFFVPHKIPQTVTYKDSNGNVIDSLTHTQDGLTGQSYTTGLPSGSKYVQKGEYLANITHNGNGLISEFHDGYTCTKDYHDGVSVTFTEHDSEKTGTGTMDYVIYDGYETVQGSLAYGQSTNYTKYIYKYIDGYPIRYPIRHTIVNPYVPQTTNIVYQYKKLGNVVNTDPQGNTTTAQYTNDPNDPTKVKPVHVPSIPGYTTQVNGKTVTDKTIMPADPGQDTKITYVADAQKASVTYVDETTGKNLKGDELKGVTNAKSGYTTKSAIDTYTSLGYTLVSDDTKGNEIVFDNDDAVDQAFTVHLSHGKITVTPEKPGKPGEPINPGEGSVNWPDDTDVKGLTDTVNRKITYVMSDGSKAPEGTSQTLHFTASKVIDKVTGKVLETETKWSANQDFKDVDSPSVKGYTPDKTVVSNKNIAHDSDDITEVVTYNADKQKASVTYIDDKTGKALKGDELKGVTNAKSGYTTKSAIDTYTSLGYTLVSDDTKGNEIVFDNDDAVDQAFTVHLGHGTTTVTPDNPGHPGKPVDPDNSDGPKYPDGTELEQVKRTGTQIIHYTGAGDKTPADNKQTFIFTREITFDNVTREIISKTPWNVQSYTFGKVNTPVIPGYHADKAVAGGETVTPDDLNKVITVTYAPDGNPGNPSDHGDTPSPEPTPEPNPTPDDQPDSEASSDEHFENVKPKDKLDKTNPKKVDAYKKQRKIIKTKIAKQGHTEIAEPIEDKVTRENNVKVVSDPVENKAAEPKLPQTGEADNSIIGLLGMLLASFAAMFGFDSLHSHDKKHKN